MGSLVSSVFGGGGGGLLGGVLGSLGSSLVGSLGGPLGMIISQAAGNLLNEAIGGAFHKVIDTLVSDFGMPKFLGDAVKNQADKALGGLMHEVSDEATSIAKDLFGSAINSIAQDFAKDLNSLIRDALGEKEANGDGSSTGGAKKAGGGWLQAIAQAMGKALGDKAAEMVSLSEEIRELSKDTVASGQEVAKLTGQAVNSPKNGAVAEKLESAKTKDQDNARQFNMKMTEFQATSQEYSMLNNVFGTALKALGEAMSSMARKQ